MSKHKLIFD